MGARILAGATVGRDSFVDAGAVVPPGTKVPNGQVRFPIGALCMSHPVVPAILTSRLYPHCPWQLWSGNPAEHLRDLSVDEMAFLRNTAATYQTVRFFPPK